MVSNYSLTILKNKLDIGFGEIEDNVKISNDYIDSMCFGIVRHYRRPLENYEYKFYCIYHEILGYYSHKCFIYVNHINPIIIDLLVLWKNSKNEKKTTSNKLLRRN